jgi:hypothetical protein
MPALSPIFGARRQAQAVGSREGSGPGLAARDVENASAYGVAMLKLGSTVSMTDSSRRLRDGYVSWMGPEIYGMRWRNFKLSLVQQKYSTDPVELPHGAGAIFASG